MMYISIFYCVFLQMMLQRLFCLCQMQLEVTTSTPHSLMYACIKLIIWSYKYGQWDSECKGWWHIVYLLQMHMDWDEEKLDYVYNITAVYSDVTNYSLIRLLLQVTLYFIFFRATNRDLPTLLHKVNNADHVMITIHDQWHVLYSYWLPQWFRT